MPGLKIPFLGISIIPVEKTAPIITPTLATVKIVFKEAALEPKAEVKKFTASLLTPTTNPATDIPTKTVNINIYIDSINKIQKCKNADMIRFFIENDVIKLLSLNFTHFMKNKKFVFNIL